MKRKFKVSGLAPHYCEGISEFAADFNLGIDVIYFEKTDVITVTIKKDTTPTQRDLQAEAVRQTYEEFCGWRDVSVKVIEGYKEESIYNYRRGAFGESGNDE